MKKVILISLLLFLSIPISVRANIICNDDTESPTCSDCHQGCCSHHGGCTKNPNSSSNEKNYSSSSGSNRSIETSTTRAINQSSIKSEKKNNIINKKEKQIYLKISEIIMILSFITYVLTYFFKIGGINL